MSEGPSRLNRQTPCSHSPETEEDVGSCGVPLHRPTLRGMAHQLFPEAVRFLVSSCLGMSQILICPGETRPKGVLSWHPNPEQQNWQCRKKGQGRVSLYLPVIQWRSSWGLLRGTGGFPKVFQPKQGAGDEPRLLGICAILTCR